MSKFVDNYHELVDEYSGAKHKGSEQIVEFYLKEENLMAFLAEGRELVRRYGINLFYGTIRFLEKNTESFLSVAPERSICVLCNLHVDHTEIGIAAATDHYRRLLDVVIKHGGR
jgi:hypothetical protein